jgi:hypothetical protein
LSSKPESLRQPKTASNGATPRTSPRLRAQVVAETRHIERDCRVASTAHFAAATFWTSIYYLLGIPATIVAGLAGLSALANHSELAAILAIAATALTATTTFLNAGEKAHAHAKKRFQYEELKNDVRVFRDVSMALIDNDRALHAELLTFAKLRNRLNRDSPNVRQKLVLKIARDLEREDALRKRGRRAPESGGVRGLLVRLLRRAQPAEA